MDISGSGVSEIIMDLIVYVSCNHSNMSHRVRNVNMNLWAVHKDGRSLSQEETCVALWDPPIVSVGFKVQNSISI